MRNSTSFRDVCKVAVFCYGRDLNLASVCLRMEARYGLGTPLLLKSLSLADYELKHNTYVLSSSLHFEQRLF